MSFMDYQERKKARVAVFNYARLHVGVKELAFKVEQQFCTCDEYSKHNGEISENCIAHDISEFMYTWLNEHFPE